MRRWLLSKNSSTDARPTGARSPAPLKITSCIDSPRSAEALDSPSTQRTASMTFDLPQPLGPTMPTSCPGVAIEAGSTNDLKPASLISVRRNSVLLETDYPAQAVIRVAATNDDFDPRRYATLRRSKGDYSRSSEVGRPRHG